MDSLTLFAAWNAISIMYFILFYSNYILLNFVCILWKVLIIMRPQDTFLLNHSRSNVMNIIDYQNAFTLTCIITKPSFSVAFFFCFRLIALQHTWLYCLRHGICIYASYVYISIRVELFCIHFRWENESVFQFIIYLSKIFK